MKQRWLEPAQDAAQKREAACQDWITGGNLPFADDRCRAAYQERATLLVDALRLEKPPKRIPVCPSVGFFPMQYGGITMRQAMYDYDALERVWLNFSADFAVDAYNSPALIVPGKALDTLDFKLYAWPGHGVPENQEYQYLEKEYMKADEYQDLIDDPTGYFLNVYFPRIFGGLEALKGMPLMPPVVEIPCVPPALFPFGTPEVQAVFQKLAEAGAEALKWIGTVRKVSGAVMGGGLPAFSGGFTKAPFDVIGDTMRGTTGMMMDMFRRPEEIKEACDRLVPFMVKAGVNSCKAAGHIMPFIPLHKGADGFMSDKQFQEFYWPSLRKLIIGLTDAGLVPQLFAEGGYNQRLEAICDLPKACTVWWFDQTDMKRAKETVGKVACIAGNVPVSILATGQPADVERYVKNLIEVAGPGGGFIMSSGAGVQGAKPENLQTMIKVGQQYGVY